MKWSIHIQHFTWKMLIIEWTTVTFCSASLLTNKYWEGGSLLWKCAPLHPNGVSVCTQIWFWDSIWSEQKKKVAWKKSIKEKKKKSPCARDYLTVWNAWYCVSKSNCIVRSACPRCLTPILADELHFFSSSKNRRLRSSGRGRKMGYGKTEYFCMIPVK